MSQFTPGNLVKYRNRDWMVLPSIEEDILLIKPLGGSDEETTGIFLPLATQEEKVTKASFEDPTAKYI